MEQTHVIQTTHWPTAYVIAISERAKPCLDQRHKLPITLYNNVVKACLDNNVVKACLDERHKP